MEILFVDACPRLESRTRKLAQIVTKHIEGNISHLKLSETILPDINEQAVLDRSLDSHNNCFDKPIYNFAKQFSAADHIVIAAPFWDLSFPAILKKYIEAITVCGITFRYTEDGIPIGLCKAQSLYYVTTAGGPIVNDSFGYGYIQSLAQTMFGIKNCHLFKAENLDVWGTDVDAIIKQSTDNIKKYFNPDYNVAG